jgi:hypothetical protein
MTQRAELLKIRFSADEQRDPPRLLRSPILRCNDATREEEDGTVWLWTDGKRPVACLCLFLIRDQWTYEHTSLTDESLEVSGRPTWKWRPKAEARTWVTVKGPVPESAPARRREARAIARQLAASEFHMGETYQLRLLDRPLHTYSDPEQGLLDGSLFTFAYGTNPEILLQVEARATNSGRKWQVAFARLSSAEITVKLEDREVWKVPAVLKFDASESYYAAHERDQPE